MDKFPDALIGMQLVGWDSCEQILTVKDNERIINLLFNDSDEGDCCGYNDFFAELLVSDHDLSINPIITNVEVKNDPEDSADYPWDDCDHVKITFFGGAKKIFQIESTSGSGSGWCYGACVTVKCKTLDIDECVTAW